MPEELLVAILAAGASRRLGRPKQLVELDGEALVRRQCRTGLDAAIGPVVLVVGCHRARVAAAVSDLPIRVVVNDEWEEGLAASVRAATRAAVASGAAALLLCHGDQYAIVPADLIRLRDAWAAAPAAACLSRDGEHLGPPAILPARLFGSMLALTGDAGPRATLRGDRDVREIPMPFASNDVDRRADLSALATRGRSGAGSTAGRASRP